MSLVLRYQQRLTQSRLLKALNGEKLPTESLGSEVALEGVRSAISDIDDAVQGSGLDQVLVEPLHRALGNLLPRDAADMRVWHWLSAEQFPSFVWRRWRPAGVPNDAELDAALSSSMIRRFAGSSTLAGVSRNTFARLWWTAHQLQGDYDLARFALSRQDMFQAVFERLFGIYGPAATASLTTFRGLGEGEIRDAAKWLNYAGSTTLLEALNQIEIEQILVTGLRPT
jgi:hypothetical protein